MLRLFSCVIAGIERYIILEIIKKNKSLADIANTMDADKFLDSELIADKQNQGVIRSFFNHIMKHPALSIVILLFLLTISFLLFTEFISTAILIVSGLIFLAINMLNSIAVYFTGFLVPKAEISFRRCFVYMIPVSLMILLTGQLSVGSRVGAAFGLNGLVLFFLFKFEASWKLIAFLCALMTFIDFMFLIGLSLLFTPS